VQDVGKRRTPSELLFLSGVPAVVRVWLAVVVTAGCGVAGYVLLRVQQRLAADVAAGAHLNPFTTLLATGSSWRTLWPGWLAAVFFVISVVRLRRGPLEPAPGRRRPEALTPTQLRRGLRAEYRAVRIVLVLLTVAAAVDTARAVAHVVAALRGDHSIAMSLAVTLAEAGGLVVAALVLALWAWTFGGDVRRLGAM